VLDHYAVVEYSTADCDVVWAETQPCDRNDYDIGDGIQVMCRPRRPRSVMIAPTQQFGFGLVRFEQNFQIILTVIRIAILIFMIANYHGFTPLVLGLFTVALSAGFGFGYMTKDRVTREEIADAGAYQRQHERLQSAQNAGVIPCNLQE